MKKFGARFSLTKSWHYASTIVIIGAALSLLLVSNLETLLPGYSQAEVQTAQSSNSFSHIIENPVNAPYKFVTFIIGSLINNDLLATRLAAITFGVFIIGLFYIGIRHWHASRTAFLSTVALACSMWFLYVARTGTPDVLLPFSILLLAVSSYWVATAEHTKFSYLAAILAIGLSVYTPGMVWFILLGLILRHKDIRLLKRRLPTAYRLVLYALFVVLIVAPITYSIIKQPQITLTLLGLPESIPSILDIAKNLILIPASVYVWSGQNPASHLGNLPLLDGFALIMTPLGIYYYYKFRALLRTKLLALSFILGIVLIALGGPVSTAILLPSAYILVAGGIALMLGQWLVVFPKNPFAKSTGILLITLIVAMSCFYNLRAYFVAWPNNTQTKQQFTQTSENLLQ